MTATIYGRLTAVESDPIGEGLVRSWHRNPDGPDAAYLLRVIARKIAVASEYADRASISHTQAALDDVLSLLRSAGVPLSEG